MTHERNLKWKIATQALHAGEETKYADAHVTPVFASSTFVFPDADVGRRRFSGEEEGYIYTRLANPTVRATEDKIAVLEGAKLMQAGESVVGHAFATGMGGVSTVLMSLTKPGDVVLATNPVYGGTNYFLDKILTPYGVETQYIPTGGDDGIEAVKGALDSQVRVIYLESPANPNLVISDIREISQMAKERDIPVVVDNTFATPILQRPLEMGADIALHSTTKYLNGHGTTVSGLIASRLTGERADRLAFVKKNLGATQSPFDAFLVLGGMKTLPLRVRQHCSNAQAIAEFLADHPKVEEVYYPGLPSHPHHSLAKKQMEGGFGGMIAAELRGGLDVGKILMNNVKIFTLAVSLGTVDSLIQHPASMTHASVPRDVRLKGGITDGLVRLSVGVEDIDDLTEDLSQALAKI